jgi:LmeA-like phospholipid-binding
VTNPQGPPSEGPPTWGRPGNQGSFGQPPTERPTEQIRTGDPAQTPPPVPGQLPTEQLATPHREAQGPGRPTPPAPPASGPRRPAAPNGEPKPAKKKRRWLRDPLSILLICITVAALVIAGLIGGELYARHVADTKVAEAVACEVKDQATASFGVAPLLLWQLATKHFTNITVSTAGNQIRDAKGMKIDINIKDVRLRDTSTSKGTIGSLDATIGWTADGIKQSVQNGIPLLGPFVTNSVTTHPSDGTIELKGMLDDITAKPVVSGTGLQLQIVSFNALGVTLPKEAVQSTLDEFTSNLTKNYPLGIHADSVEVTSTGVTSHFSTQNANIPTGNDGQDPCFANV